MNLQVGETVEAQYVPLEGEVHLTEVPEAALQDNGNNSISDQHAVDTQKTFKNVFLLEVLAYVLGTLQ